MTKPLLKQSAEHFVFRIPERVFPDRTETTYEPRDPIRCLNCLIAMAFEMERRLDELPPRVTRPIHASRCLCDEVGTLIVFVEGQHKVISWITVLGTESIDPLNGFEKDLRVEAIRVVPVRWSSLPDPNVEHKTVEFADLIEHTVCELPEFSILSDVVYRIETRPLLLPHGRMCPRAFDLEVKKLAFALEEPRSESADFCRRQDVSGETDTGLSWYLRSFRLM